MQHTALNPVKTSLSLTVRELEALASAPDFSKFERLQLESVLIYLEAARSNLQAIELYGQVFDEGLV